MSTIEAVRPAAFTGLSQPLDHPLTAEEALDQAGLNWQVKKAPIFAEIPGVGSAHVPGRLVTYRDDTNQPLGVVGRDWTPVQNADAFRFMDELVGGGELLYEQIVSLEGGAKVALLARTPDYLTVGGIEAEKVASYIMLCNGHAGTLAFRVRFLQHRIACANVLPVRGDGIFSGRHTSGIEYRVNDARAILNISWSKRDAFHRMAEELLAKRMTPRQETSFVERLIPLKVEVEADSRAAKNAEEARNAVLAIMRNAENLDNVRGTAYGALQAATEYADWHTRTVGSNGERAERRFKRNWMRDDPIKVRAMQLLAPEFVPARKELAG